VQGDFDDFESPEQLVSSAVLARQCWQGSMISSKALTYDLKAAYNCCL
jgi:hypothetical protein